MNRQLFGIALLAIVCPGRAIAGSEGLVDLSLEQLGNVEVTSVSKKPERLAEAPASIYVIFAEEIRRSGAITLPEALRLAPNLHVAQASSYGYAISARGMNGSNNSAPNKMLVLIDGRSVYSPLFAGVFWDAQDLMLEDIERIEVISGPGGTLWGVNAVNAVVNIITRDASGTQGPLLALGAGQPDSQAAFRYGGALGQTGFFRAYVKLLNKSNTETAAGTAIDDAGHKAQLGFRVDVGEPANHFNLSGSVYRGLEGQPAPGSIAVDSSVALGDVEFSGSNLTARWNRTFESGSTLRIQAYYDRTERTVPPTFSERLDILDLELQHSLAAIGRHSLSWGFNYRHGRDRLVNSPHVAFLPARVNQSWMSIFLQDRIALGDELDLTIGARVERNDYTGNEFLPSARISWTPKPNQLLWAAASRAVRAPSRLDRDVHLPGDPPFLLDGGPLADSEIADVYEIGYRGQLSPRTTYSATLFHAEYDHLRTLEIVPAGTHYVFGGLMEGQATGVEMWGKFQATPSWRLSGGLTALREEFHLKPGSNDFAGPSQAGNDPRTIWKLRSSWNLGEATEFDLGLRHVAELERNSVPAYTSLDARLAWRSQNGFELSVTGRNLTGSHAEYGALVHRAELERGVLFSLVWTPDVQGR